MRRSITSLFRPTTDTGPTGQEKPMTRRGPVLLAVGAAVCLAAIAGGVVTVAGAMQQPQQVTEIGSTPVIGPSRAPGSEETPGSTAPATDPAATDPAAPPAAPTAPTEQVPPAEQSGGTAPVPVVPVPAPAPADPDDDDGDDEDTDDPDDDVDDDLDD
ncbi:hypothetical protein ASF48_14810 [Rathayibacter sp. Leaf299]|uniref:hypothetical protein n=1 Tax=Rathayibacter sp. Leaf299 TaxID=1736328 RepID=UPI0006FA912E|nr:hypothetical protein [Rathayibacter sp. Leaf299]KQQ19217.1 hypothetical protein ASF48_14810 [Rathayibacter sp. Leaf299]